MRSVVVLSLGLALAGCMGQYDFKDLDGTRIAPTAVIEKKIPGKYVVAIVGNLEQPVTGTTNWSRGYGPDLVGADLTFHVGVPLKKAVTAAVQRSFAEPVFVTTEAEARAAARNGGGAVIVRYAKSETGGESKQNLFGYHTHIYVVLEGEAVMLSPGGAETQRGLYARGGDAKQGAAFTWSEIITPVAKQAAEDAIAAFADRVVNVTQETLGRR